MNELIEELHKLAGRRCHARLDYSKLNGMSFSARCARGHYTNEDDAFWNDSLPSKGGKCQHPLETNQALRERIQLLERLVVQLINLVAVQEEV
jgi:hypothetical protein